MTGLSEKEQALRDRFVKEKVIAVRDMVDTECGCLGKLAARGIVVKDRVPIGGATKLQTVWRIAEEEKK